MKLCGLTGGVGMGKSTAAGFFAQSGLCLVDTDDLAHQLVQPGQPALAEIQGAFGVDMIAPDGSLDRKKLARIVFADAQARKRLEAILHPRIRERWQAQIEDWRTEQCSAGMVVIPLLFETGAETQFDKIICVACSPVGQHERLRSRGWSDEHLRDRISAQMAAEQKIARSHFVIWTEGSLDNHRRQVERIVKSI